MTQDDKLSILKDILLTDQREYVSSIEEKIRHLEDVINTRQHLSKKVSPIIKDELSQFITDLPKTLGPTITETLKKEIKNSQDTVVEALYPIMGKMIKRYIQNEMSMLVENINNKVNNTFSFANLKRKLKAKGKGISEAELFLQKEMEPQIEQIMIIEKGSGLLISEYSKTQKIDEHMVAGLLTAIKSFVEDAFKQNNQDLQYIEYDTYHIHIQNFSKYYVAVVISGLFNKSYRDNLEDKLLDFAKNYITNSDFTNPINLNNKLELYFGED